MRCTIARTRPSMVGRVWLAAALSLLPACAAETRRPDVVEPLTERLGRARSSQDGGGPHEHAPLVAPPPQYGNRVVLLDAEPEP